jgi:hypothetical protein
MREPPTDLITNLNDEERARTTAWWTTLNDEAQLEFIAMWDARADDTALFATCADGDITWHEIPIELRGALLDEENDVEHKQAKQQLLEYIANHEEISFFLVDRKFHICRAHPAARALLLVAAVATVACSFEPSTCDEAACDAETEYCRLFGSDTPAPSSASCVALPEECAEAPDCACMLAAEDENSIATCDDSGDVVVMTVPGG